MKKNKKKYKNKGKKSNLVESIIIIFIRNKKIIKIAREWEKKRDDKF